MADTVTRSVIHEDGARAIIEATWIYVDTGQSGATLVDVSADFSDAIAPSLVEIEKIDWVTCGVAVKVLWDADTDSLAIALPQDSYGRLNFIADTMALKNPKTTNYTGDVQATTVGHAAGDSYWMRIHVRKIP